MEKIIGSDSKSDIVFATLRCDCDNCSTAIDTETKNTL